MRCVVSFVRPAVIVVAAAWLLAAPRLAAAASPALPPPLPPPAGAVVTVTNASELELAVSSLRSNTTILLAPGVYRLSSTLYVNGPLADVAIRGASDSRDDVVIVGPGMTNASYGNVRFGIWVGGDVRGLLVANLTLREFYSHPIMFNAGVENPHVYNVRLADAGEQLLKSNPDGIGGGVDNGRVEYSVFEYSTYAPSTYTNGIDVHGGAGWVIRHNVFRNITVSSGALTGPAVLMWNHASGTLTEGNLFVNCSRGIAYGLIVNNLDHTGGIIRNNVFFRAAGQPGDVAIGVADSPDTQVLNNTVFTSGTYGTPIEYRFAASRNIVVANNLLDGAVWARDGAAGSESQNLPASADMFANAAAGDLHLVSNALSAIDRGLATSSVLEDWDGEARPQGSAPDVGADEYGASPQAFTIAGRVTSESGGAVSGVAMALSGSRAQTATTDANGLYSFGSLASGGNYTVTPSKTGLTFNPADAYFAGLGSDQLSASFVAIAPAPPPPLPAAPKIEAIASGARSGAYYNFVRTSYFSTTSGSQLLLAFVAVDDPAGGGNNVTRVDGAGLTWVLVRRTHVQLGTAEIWRAFAPTPLTSVRIRATYMQYAAGSITVVSFSGVDTSGTNGSGAIGATGSGNASRGAPTASLTTTRANSWVFGIGNDFDNPIARTPGSDQVLVYQYMPSVGDTYWVQRTAQPIAVSGTRVTINDVAPTSDRYNLTIAEVLAHPSTTEPEPAPAPPSVTLTGPVSGASYTAPASISVSASASAASGATLSKVDFFAGTTPIGTDTSAPYSVSWGNVAAGNYSLSAVATDSNGATSVCPSVSITVNEPPPAPVPPTIALGAPVNGSTFTAPASITASATASGNGGASVTKVEFFAGALLVGTDTSSPYSATWSDVAAGSYTMTAVATDSNGLTTRSAAAGITVSAPPAPTPLPATVSLTSPAGGSTFTAPASVTIGAAATASSGASVTRVDFFAGASLVGTDASSPYSVTWTNVAAGSYSLTAMVVDSTGANVRSAAAEITVNAAPPPPPPPSTTGLIQPSDLTYLGAFRVQEAWKPNYATMEYSNAPIAYYPSGDPTGASDGFPGSLFIGGHTYAGNVKEIKIPAPVKSKTLSSLPIATELRPFVDVSAGLGSKPGGAFIMGMTYVPSQDRILFTYSGDYSDTIADCDPAGMGGGLGWFSPSQTGQAGLWYLSAGGSRLHPYTSLRYIMEVPQAWADANLQGKYVASGRHRGWCPEGTNLYASAPWSSGTPASGSNVAATTLMQFGSYTETTKWSREHSSANAYQGGAWLTAGNNAAQIITGIIDYDSTRSYYGYENWVYPNQCEPSGTCVGSRGWRAADPRAAILFYNPQDLAAVANGTKQSWEVQWYAKLDIEPYMLRNYAPTYLTTGADAETLLATFDRQNGYLYISESFADGVKPVVHVFKVAGAQ